MARAHIEVLGKPDADQLLARVQIDALNAEFAYLIDHDLSERVADLFMPNGTYGFDTGQRSVGHEAIRLAYAKRRARGDRTTRHLFTNLHLRFESAHRASGTCLLLLFARDGRPPLPATPLMVADYEDVYVQDPNGQWRYESRTISTVFSDTTRELTVLPLGQR